ncbi:hypothetical protein HT136_01385 [Novosphingobium profundi]|uniref:hypothetical protein n=1 Tax=Novosphingobium profundi TaxID=1774954 RepID=UPI001BDA347C|nr:hypothetical protein [Novosphingobium profundi]MBT0667019.1 hypothetical protein [Novosphingobium profundi]
MSGNPEQQSSADAQELAKVKDAELNADGLALIAAKLEEMGYPVAEGGVIAETACTVLDMVQAAAAQAEEQLAAAKRQLSGQKSQVTKARNAHAQTQAALAEALARDPEAKLRKLPGDPPAYNKDKFALAELCETIQGADELELVAFMGEAEVGAIPALALRKGMAAFKVIGAGLVLAIDTWLVTGPAQLDGWGLYADGELILYRKRAAGQLQIGAGQSFNLTHDVLL